MKLFFETAGQSACFLAAIPLGFGLAFCLDLGQKSGLFRAILDVAALMIFGLMLLLLVLFLSEEKLRMYHLLGTVIGAVLYMKGAGEILRLLRRLFQKEKQKNEEQAGITHSGNEIIANENQKG